MQKVQMIIKIVNCSKICVRLSSIFWQLNLILNDISYVYALLECTFIFTNDAMDILSPFFWQVYSFLFIITSGAINMIY